MLTKKHRFHRRNHVAKVYKDGKSVRGQFISLKIKQHSNQEPFRVAVVVSKKVSKSAVVRNHIRRRIFAAVEREATYIPTGTDLIFTVYDKSVATLDFAGLHNQVFSLLSKTIKSDIK